MKYSRNGSNSNARKPILSPAKARKEDWKKEIVDLYLKGHTMRQIVDLALESTGHKFGLPTVHKYIHEAVDQWKEQKTEMVANHKAIELAKINTLESTYWDAWLRSCELQQKTSKVKKKGSEDGRLAVAQQKTDEHRGLGDPRYLTGIQWCIEQRCKILGIEVPQLPPSVTNNTQINNTTVIRKVVFKTRETTATQVIKNSA